MAEPVPGFSELPLALRARVRALAFLQTALDRMPIDASNVFDRAPEALQNAVRRASLPARIGRIPSALLDPVRAADELEPRALAVPSRKISSPDASVIVPTHGSIDWFRLCLLALRAHTQPERYELVVIDDGSTHPRDIERILETHGAATLLRQNENLGFAAAVNRGAREARGETLVILNDDAVVTPGWLDGLLAAICVPHAGLVGPISNDTGDVATVDAHYTSLDQLLLYAEGCNGAPRAVRKLSLFCAAVRRSVFDQIGGLDERYARGLFEDDDFCMALARRGYDLVLCPSVFVHHAGGASFRRLSPFEYHARFAVNRLRFERRWSVRWTNGRL